MRIRNYGYVSGCASALAILLFGTNVALADDPGLATLSDPLDAVTDQELQDFEDGLEVFERAFGLTTVVGAPPIGGPGGAPLGGGPLRNTFGPNSCGVCHSSVLDTENLDSPNTVDRDGGANAGFRATQVTAHDPVAGTCDHLGDRGGPGFQVNTGGAGEMGIDIAPQEAGGPFDGLGGEYIPLTDQFGNPVGPADDRTTNDLFGLGLLDALTDERLTEMEDPDDADGDGISGRVHWVTDHHGEIRAGKFGRKAEVAHLDEFNAEAFQNEQGVTNSEFLSDGVTVSDSTGGILTIASLEDGTADPEVSDHDMELLNAYVRFLAPPEDNTDSLSKKDQGKANGLFHSTGCAKCHVPQLKTGHHDSDVLSKVTIHPYTDMLLHDMGPEMAEGCKGDALPSEWRTEPLWGLRFVPVGVPAPFPGLPPMGYLHDGRALTLDEAIQWHGGEAATSRDNYNDLSDDDRQLLLDFLMTL